MFALGDKIESKKLATSAKVNVIPGRLTEAEDIGTVLQIGMI
jgi:acetyl/propionyl-CoA carboxylase alpha subunit